MGLYPARARCCSRVSASMNASPSRRRAPRLRSAIGARLGLRGNPLGDVRTELVSGNADLLERVSVTNRDRAVLRRLTIDRDAERRAHLILPTIPPADRATVVVEHRERAAEIISDAVRHLGHAVLLHEREYARLDRRDGRREPQDRAALALA